MGASWVLVGCWLGSWVLHMANAERVHVAGRARHMKGGAVEI